MDVSVPHVHSTLVAIIRWQILRNQNYRWLWLAMWMSWTKCRSSARVIFYWPISPCTGMESLSCTLFRMLQSEKKVSPSPEKLPCVSSAASSDGQIFQSSGHIVNLASKILGFFPYRILHLSLIINPLAVGVRLKMLSLVRHCDVGLTFFFVLPRLGVVNSE